MRRPTTMPGVRAAAIAIAAAALLSACRGGTGARPTAATSSPAGATATSVPSPSPSQVRPLGTRVWLVAFRVAADPRDLNADTQLLLSRVGGATVVSPAMCFEGLPGGIQPSDYVMGVVAGTRAELRRFVAESGFDPLFEAQVRVTCTD